MIANVLSHENGVGLSNDIEIVSGHLRRLGFRVERTDCVAYQPLATFYDVNVFIELFRPEFLQHARESYIIPNQEWTGLHFERGMRRARRMLCKTRIAEELYAERRMRTEYIGFTSRDRFRPKVTRDQTKWLHLMGRSTQKGTAAVLAAWAANPAFPRLTVVCNPDNGLAETLNAPPNVDVVMERLSDDDLETIMNSHVVHVCPSDREGFGHAINEAHSCGAVMITTDAPPMNELVTPDDGVLVRYESVAEGDHWRGFTSSYRVSSGDLATAVRRVMALPATARAAIGMRGRDAYLARDRRFAERFAGVFTRVRRRLERDTDAERRVAS